MKNRESFGIGSLLIVEEKEFNTLCGDMIPFREYRDVTPLLIGQIYRCACGRHHEIETLLNIVGVGLQGKLLLLCPIQRSFATLVQLKKQFTTQLCWMESIAGYRDVQMATPMLLSVALILSQSRKA